MVQPPVGLLLQAACHLPKREDREAADREKGAKQEKPQDPLRDGPAQNGKRRSHDGSRSVFGGKVYEFAGSCADDIVKALALIQFFLGHPVGAHAVEVVVQA